jgi:aminoglycoside phosphotransferase (APT) family kinase protein
VGSNVTDQLLAAVKACTRNDDLEWVTTPQPLAGGFTTEMWRVRLRGSMELDGELVARVMPEADGARRETIVQRHLAAEGFATPSVRLAGEPSPELAQAWMLMDYVAGAPLLDGLEGPSVVLAIPGLVRSLPDNLARCAAALHEMPVEALRRELGTDDEIVNLLERMRSRVDAAGRADLGAVADGLVSTRPPRIREVVCHGDLHPLNVLTGPDGLILIDWSTARIADPTYDLAFTMLLLSHPPLTVPAPARSPVRAAGRLLGRRFIRAYQRHSKHRVDPTRLHWYTRLSALRVLTELEVTSDPANHPFRHLEPVAQRLSDWPAT